MEEISKSKPIPYGVYNFASLREGNCYYVDKTRYIEEIESSSRYFFFIRPRRFGKSLLLSMLQSYYDILQTAFRNYLGGYTLETILLLRTTFTWY
jgi:hypothetical protein